MVTEVRTAGIEGFLILGAIYLVLNMLSKAGKKAATQDTLPPTEAGAAPSSTQMEGLSLEQILRDIQRVKQEKGRYQAPKAPPQRKTAPQVRKPLPGRRTGQVEVQPERGPLGRHSRTRLPEAEEVEERASLEGGSLEVEEQLEVIDDRPARRQRVEVDSDDSAEALVQRRIREAEARNRPINAADHQRFDAQIRDAAPVVAAKAATKRSRLQDALVWREILGPPKSME